MAVAADGEMRGTIGGGIMEHKLVEKARVWLQKGKAGISLIPQYHNKQHPHNQSGMICAGAQKIAFISLSSKDLPTIKLLLSPNSKQLTISHSGLSTPQIPTILQTDFYYQSDEDWHYKELLNSKPTLHIFGGGHVGLALSEVMVMLDFNVNIYDNRPNLNTLTQNTFAHKQYLVPYEQVLPHLSIGPQDYIVLATFGYRQDKLLFQQLMHMPCRYIGMMGSDAKLKQLREELLAEGMTPSAWERLHAPIGLPILSKTAKEIAVSVAAEIILEKNKGLPTGRI